MEEGVQQTTVRSRAFLDKNPDGVPFVDIFWNKSSHDELSVPAPGFLRPARSPIYLLILLAGAMFVIGFLGAFKAVAAVGLGIFGALLYCYWRVWRQSADWIVENLRYTESIIEGEEVELRFDLRSKSGTALPELEVSLQFNGSQYSIYRKAFASLGESQHQVKFTLQCDKGMGEYLVKPIYLTMRDPLGLFSLSLPIELDVFVEARPNIVPLYRFPQPDSGVSLNSGALKSKKPGESVSFLGLREWRVGDGIRKIDWKRSLQGRQLMVKVFESDVSTDVTLIMDLSSRAHSEFGKLSSIESMRDSAASLVDHFVGRQQRVQLFGCATHIPLGGGHQHRDLLLEQIADLKVEFIHDFAERLKEIPPLLPSGSMVCLMLGTSSCSLEDLLEFLLALEIKRVELFLILFDSERFAHAVTSQAQVEQASLATLQTFYRSVLGDTKGTLQKLVSQLPERTIVIGPEETLTEAVEEAL